MVEYLDSLDKSLLLWLNSFHTSFFDNFMFLVSDKIVWIPLYLAIFTALVMRFGMSKKLIAALGVFALAIAFTDTLCAEVIRPIVCRPRPSHDDSGIAMLVHIVNGQRGGHYGYPSCHGANSFALAIALSLIMRLRRIVLFIYAWAIVHSYSRIYLGVHYPGDILTGAIIGTCVAAAVYYGMSRIASMSSGQRDIESSNVVIITGCVIIVLLLAASYQPVFESVHALLK